MFGEYSAASADDAGALLAPIIGDTSEGVRRHRRCLRRVLPMSGEVVQIDECRKDTYAVFQYGYEGSKCAK